MPTPYEKLYENILPKFKSFEIPLMSVEEVKELLHDYINPACTHFHTCRKNLYNRDEENECFNDDLSDREIDILGNYMVIVYTDSNYIRVPTLLKAHLSSSDFNAFSPANHLDKLTEMHKTFLSENDTILSRYSWEPENPKIKDIKKHSMKKKYIKF